MEERVEKEEEKANWTGQVCVHCRSAVHNLGSFFSSPLSPTSKHKFYYFYYSVFFAIIFNKSNIKI